jgi:thioredoxin
MHQIKSFQELDQALDKGKLVLVNFYADWCSPCKTMMPMLEFLSEDLKGQLNIFKINIESEKEIADEFKIKSVPALFFIKDRKVLERMTGLQSIRYLRNRIEEYR